MATDDRVTQQPPDTSVTTLCPGADRSTYGEDAEEVACVSVVVVEPTPITPGNDAGYPPPIAGSATGDTTSLPAAVARATACSSTADVEAIAGVIWMIWTFCVSAQSMPAEILS